MSVLSVEKLVKRFVGPDGRPLAAVDELSFELPEEARLITIAGPDGAGKSTLLRLLVGLLTPDAGDIRVLGLSPDKASLSGRTGFMPQKFGLYEELTVLENLETFAALRGVPKAEAPARFSELLSLTGLAGFEERRAGALSGGMKQKLGLTASLLATPELLFLDEPTVGVDPLSRRELKNILRTRTETTGMRAIVTTSNLAEAEEADLVLLMDKGRLLDVTTPEAARRRLSRRTFLLRAADPADAKTLTRGALDLVNAEMGEAAPFLDASPKADGVAVLLADEAKEADLAAKATAAGLPALSVSARAPLMEDVYVDAAFARKASAHFSAPKVEAGSEDLVIEAEGICRRFGSFTAVADTSFTVKKGDDTKLEASGNGVLVEAFVDSDDNVTLVVINTYVGEVSKVVDADSVKKDEEPYIEIAGLTGNGGKFETNASFDEDDVVLYTVADGDIQTVTMAKKIEDQEVTSKTGDTKFVADGETYKYNKNHRTYDITLKSSVDIYTDNYGYVVYVEEYEAGSASVAFVLNFLHYLS